MFRPKRQKSAAARDLVLLEVGHAQPIAVEVKALQIRTYPLALPNPHTKKNPPHLLQLWSSSKFRDNRRHLTTVHRKSIRSKN